MADSNVNNVKPGRKNRRVFKPKSGTTDVSRSAFEAARNDRKAADFLEKAKAEGETLQREGLIHR
jgi:hypothetical protein